jgi:hypothetical protein
MFLFRGEKWCVGVIPRSQKNLDFTVFILSYLGYVKDKMLQRSDGIYRVTTATAGKDKSFELARITS